MNDSMEIQFGMRLIFAKLKHTPMAGTIRGIDLQDSFQNYELYKFNINYMFLL